MRTCRGFKRLVVASGLVGAVAVAGAAFAFQVEHYNGDPNLALQWWPVTKFPVSIAMEVNINSLLAGADNDGQADTTLAVSLPQAVDGALRSWEAVQCDDGVAKRFTLTAAYTEAAVQLGDGKSTVAWFDAEHTISFEGVPEPFPFQGVLGLTFRTANEVGTVVEADIVFNNQDFYWRTSFTAENPRAPVLLTQVETGNPDRKERLPADVETVMLHEAGHVLGLGHPARFGPGTDTVPAIMIPRPPDFARDADNTVPVFVRRGLDRDDKQGLCYLYQRSVEFESNAEGAKDLKGAAATSAVMFNPTRTCGKFYRCPEDEVCRATAQADGTTDFKCEPANITQTRCSKDTPCSGGDECTEWSGICHKDRCTNDAECGPDSACLTDLNICVKGKGAAGECKAKGNNQDGIVRLQADGGQCVSNLCNSATGRCAQPCSIVMPEGESDCPQGFRCSNFAVPGANGAVGELFACLPDTQATPGGEITLCNSDLDCKNSTGAKTAVCALSRQCAGFPQSCSTPDVLVGSCLNPVDGRALPGDACSKDDDCLGGVCTPAGFCGKPCNTTADCGTGRTCQMQTFAAGSGNLAAAAICVVGADCRSHVECAVAATQAGVGGDLLCLPFTAPSEALVTACSHALGTVKPSEDCDASAPLGANGCESGYCHAGEDGKGMCLDTCSFQSDCPFGFKCRNLSYENSSTGTKDFVTACVIEAEDPLPASTKPEEDTAACSTLHGAPSLYGLAVLVLMLPFRRRRRKAAA